jgi:hypothetical protein
MKKKFKISLMAGDGSENRDSNGDHPEEDEEQVTSTSSTRPRRHLTPKARAKAGGHDGGRAGAKATSKAKAEAKGKAKARVRAAPATDDVGGHARPKAKARVKAKAAATPPTEDDVDYVYDPADFDSPDDYVYDPADFGDPVDYVYDPADFADPHDDDEVEIIGEHARPKAKAKARPHEPATLAPASSSSSSSSSGAPAAGAGAASRLVEAHESDMTCVICMDRRRNMALQPCGHLVLCRECAGHFRRGSRCPICKGRVTRTQEMFM